MRLPSFILMLVGAVLLGLLPASAAAAWSRLEAIEARDDFAGRYRQGGVEVFRFVGEAAGVEQDLLDHYRDPAKFGIAPAAYTLAELEAVQKAITGGLAEFRAGGLDIREVGVDVVGNRVDVGAYRNLQGTREALAEYGDKVHIFWSEGGFTGPQPIRETAVKAVDDVKLRLTLDRWPLVAGKPAWITAKIRNEGDTPITYRTDACEIAVGVTGRLLDEQWRDVAPTDVEAIRAAGRSEYLDFRWRVQEWTAAGQDSIYLDFVPRRFVDMGEISCFDVGISHRVAPGGVVEERHRWDGQASGSFGPPPQGLARVAGSFDFRRAGTARRQTIEVELEVPVTKGRDPAVLQPMEAVDAALADDTFRELIGSVNLGHAAEEYVIFDDRRDVWVVGACTDGYKWKGNWRAAAVVDSLSGEVKRVLERVTGEACHRGPWPRR